MTLAACFAKLACEVIMILSLLISMAFAQGAPGGAVLAKAPVFEAVEQSDKKTPLGGSFEEGEKRLRAADPETEAATVFAERGLTKVIVCGFACLAPGVDASAFVDAKGLTVPATSDAQSAKSKGYNEAANAYATRFNQKMLALKVPAIAGDVSTPVAGPIDREFSAKELTINGVLIGKSNLYNAVGKFGTNMFHKEGSVSLVCWKGDDGTILEFKSDPEHGAKDNAITDARVIAGGTEYASASTCKPSKKVSASLALVGVSLNDSASDLEKKLGVPSVKTDSQLTWNFLKGNPAKGMKSDVEATLSNAKVTSIRLDRAPYSCPRGSSCGGSAH